MEFTIHLKNGKKIAEITALDLFISSAGDFLDTIANLQSDRIVIKKEMLDESFFDLRTGLAGEILQKASNYFVRLAVLGGYSSYTSKSLKDFIFESNKKNLFVFVSTTDEAVERMAKD